MSSVDLAEMAENILSTPNIKIYTHAEMVVLCGEARRDTKDACVKAINSRYAREEYSDADMKDDYARGYRDGFRDTLTAIEEV